MPTIEYVFRRPAAGNFSIETLFQSVSGFIEEDGEFRVSRAVVPCISRGVWPRVRNFLWAYRRRRKCDLFHITGDVTYLGMAMPSDRTIVTFHDARGMDEYAALNRTLFREIWVKGPCRRVAAVTVVSNESAGRILRHVPQASEKLHVIPNAVSPLFQPSPRPIHASCPIVLQVGAGDNKNVGRVALALKGLDCEFHIIGRPNGATSRILEQCNIRYRLSSNLTAQEILSAYQEADVVTFCSTIEGFGMPILEAQWVERPVVTSNCSSMPEVAGKGACLVDPFDVASIRRGIERVFFDARYRDSLIAEGRINRERFTLKSVANMYMELYRKVLG